MSYVTIMEADSCINAINESRLLVPDACRSSAINGCVKSVSIDPSQIGVGSNNNTSNGANVPAVFGIVSNPETEEGDLNISHDVCSHSVVHQEITDMNCVDNSQASFSICEETTTSPEQETSGNVDTVIKVTNSYNTHSDSSSANSISEVNSALENLTVSSEFNVPSNGPLVKIPTCTTDIQYIVYESERQMGDIMKLITKDLSEPYSIYTYRYFIHNWPRLCYLAMDGDKCVGAIVCKLDRHRSTARRGYIAMLAVDQDYRRFGIGSNLVIRAIKSMTDPINGGCDEVVLETEISNSAALHLYEKLGFIRDKRLFRYYLNGVDALRLKLWLK